jgi:hypothetical protein
VAEADLTGADQQQDAEDREAFCERNRQDEAEPGGEPRK